MCARAGSRVVWAGFGDYGLGAVVMHAAATVAVAHMVGMPYLLQGAWAARGLRVGGAWAARGLRL